MKGWERLAWALCCILLVSGGAWGAPRYDVVVVGAGAGGCAAAIQGARMGARVALVEESSWIGGQMTGAAVSTMDDQGRNRSGIYRELLDRVREHYARLGRGISTCYWGADTAAFEPRVGQQVLTDLLREAQGSGGSVDLFLRTRPVAAAREGDRLVAVSFLREGLFPLELSGKVFVDATECGDLIPLTGARYRAGNRISPNLDLEANIQDLTQVAVVRRYPEGLPRELRVPADLLGYREALPRFRKVVTRDGNRWPGKYPFDIPSHNAYRGLPDPANPLPVSADVPDTWGNVTKTGINWANDYPANGGEKPGLSVRYLEDRATRREVDRLALLRTLQFLRYFQTELGLEDWSVDRDQGFSGPSASRWESWKVLSPDLAPILESFPPFPYVRESRRILGLLTLTASDIRRDRSTGKALKRFPHAFALGEYPIDIHGSHLDRYLEHDLGEGADTFPKTWVPSEGVFQVPFEVFVPERVDGLVAAEKNLSVSRMVNGAIRLQPIALLTGQAAGALAALAAREGVPPRAVDPLKVQVALWQGRSHLSMDRFDDVPDESPWWPGVEAATLYGWLAPFSDRSFAPLLPLSARQAAGLLAAAGFETPEAWSAAPSGTWVSREEFSRALGGGALRGPEPVTRGEALGEVLRRRTTNP